MVIVYIHNTRRPRGTPAPRPSARGNSSWCLAWRCVAWRSPRNSSGEVAAAPQRRDGLAHDRLRVGKDIGRDRIRLRPRRFERREPARDRQGGHVMTAARRRRAAISTGSRLPFRPCPSAPRSRPRSIASALPNSVPSHAEVLVSKGRGVMGSFCALSNPPPATVSRTGRSISGIKPSATARPASSDR